MINKQSNTTSNLECCYLFHQHRELSSHLPDTPHAHSFWQIDIIYEGTGFFIANNEKQEFIKNDIIVIPSGVKHLFQYSTDNCKWLSIKFSVNNNTNKSKPEILNNPVLKEINKVVNKLLPLKFIPDNSLIEILNSTLKIIIQFYEIKSNAPQHNNTAFLEQIFEYVALAQGKYVTVNDVARATGFTAKYLSKRFKREAGCPLKRYLDEERFKHASRLLCFTESTISEIANELDFADVYSFSRFFKRWSRQSPKYYRQNFNL